VEYLGFHELDLDRQTLYFHSVKGVCVRERERENDEVFHCGMYHTVDYNGFVSSKYGGLRVQISAHKALNLIA